MLVKLSVVEQRYHAVLEVLVSRVPVPAGAASHHVAVGAARLRRRRSAIRVVGW